MSPFVSTEPRGSIMELQPLSDTKNADQEELPPLQNVAEQYPSGFRFIALTFGIMLSIFLSALDTSILATAIPRITDDFGTVKDVGWYSTAYMLTNTAFASSWGRGYKFFPILPTLAAAVAIFETGNVVCATAPSSAALILGRIIAGLGGSGIISGSFIIIAISVKPQQRAAYMGIIGVTFGASSIAGPLLGGFLTDGPGWRWCFWISLPIGIFAVCTVALAFKPPTSSNPQESSLKEKLLALDLVGACLILGALTCFVLAMERAGVTLPWNDWRVITSLIGSVALIAVFIVNEKLMGDRAMIQRDLIKRRSIMVNLIYQFFLSGLFFPLSYLLPLQFQSVGNASATKSGLLLIPLILGVSVFTMVANGILTFYRFFTPFLLLGAIAGTLGAVLVQTINADAPIGIWIAYEAVIGLGVGIALQVPMVANQAAVGVEDIAAVTALTLFAENVGVSLFIASSEAAFTNGLVKSLAQKTPRLSPELVLNAGVTRIRTAFESEDIQGILSSYLEASKTSQLIPIACGASAILVSMVIVVPEAAKKLGGNIRKRA